MTVINAYVLFCIANEKMSLLDFRRIIVRAYMHVSSLSDPKNAGRPSLSKPSIRRVPDDIRKSNSGHILQRTENGKQRKCALCKTNVRKQCSKCNVGLHVECFSNWHQ